MARGQARRGDAGEAFWRFSLSFYAQLGVAAALIALQDRDGCDVNLILFAMWAGIVGRHAIDAAGLATAEAAGAGLRDPIVVELRRLRRRLRSDPDPDVQSLRRRIAALEIAAERLVQRRLAEAIPISEEPRAEADPEAAAAGNLALVLGGAAASAEAAILRRAISRFVRRR
jgi:uncharacterized protein (TIGR02444 family)